jgi:hypothetical protein
MPYNQLEDLSRRAIPSRNAHFGACTTGATEGTSVNGGTSDGTTSYADVEITTHRRDPDVGRGSAMGVGTCRTEVGWSAGRRAPPGTVSSGKRASRTHPRPAHSPRDDLFDFSEDRRPPGPEQPGSTGPTAVGRSSSFRTCASSYRDLSSRAQGPSLPRARSAHFSRELHGCGFSPAPQPRPEATAPGGLPEPRIRR